MYFAVPYLVPAPTIHNVPVGDEEDLRSTIHSEQQDFKRIALRRRAFIKCSRWLPALFLVYLFYTTGLVTHLLKATICSVENIYQTLLNYEWKASASFHVTDAMKMSIAMSMALGILLGLGVGLVSGLEPAVVIGVSASMAMGCVFVMSFAILHGVNALRAISFAIFVSICLPFGFGFGFGFGILVGVFLGLEDPDDIREKMDDFITNFGDFVRVVTAFTLEIR